MSAQCDAKAQNCYYECCSKTRQCPEAAKYCYYYYLYDNNNTEAGGGLSSGAIVGITLGSIAGGILLILLLLCCYLRCRERKRRRVEESITATTMPAYPGASARPVPPAYVVQQGPLSAVPAVPPRRTLPQTSEMVLNNEAYSKPVPYYK